ncbi:MAG TPA: T9SS type A sorting domain-containing protein [Ignavibacteriales bacterium]|nr:T9SS type A sorting domain-containing protein [Ignavibacteriales bacterium]
MKTLIMVWIITAFFSVNNLYSQNVYWERLPYQFLYGNSVPVADTAGNIYIGNSGSIPGYAIYRSTDNGINWTKRVDTVSGYIAGVFCISVSSKGIIYASTSMGLFNSTDNGSSWTNLKSNASLIMTILPNDIMLTAGGEDISRSTDEGKTWTKVYNIGSRNYALSLEYNLASGYLYVSSELGLLFISKDNGVSWNQINPDVQILHVDRKGVLWGLLRSKGTLGRSYDNGASFSDLSPALNWTGSLAFDDQNNAYAGTYDKGVYFSSDNGKTWTSASNGLSSFFWIKYMSFDKKGYLYGVSGNDSVNYSPVFRSTSPVTAVNDSHEGAVNSYQLFNNFPNPFNPSTTISYSIPKESYVELKVFDMLGREVASLVNKEQSAGEYKVKFDASSLSSGIYIYSLTAGDFRASKKLMLLR